VFTTKELREKSSGDHGASGAIYGLRLLEPAAQSAGRRDPPLFLTRSGEKTFFLETGRGRGGGEEVGGFLVSLTIGCPAGQRIVPPTPW